MTKWAIIILAAAGLILGAGLALNAAVSTVAGMVKDAGDSARAERDAHWQAEIAKSNEAVAKAQLQQAEHAAEVDADARDKIAIANRQLVELRKDSDALGDIAGGGLSAASVELLNR
jgi:hypothetical protein